tara:strand:+ start:389 stop:559 length:171 start_codon:yes stop_codon:yes gene_type:complete
MIRRRKEFKVVKVKSNTVERRIIHCTSFKEKHPITEDVFKYLDYIIYLKKINIGNK